MQQTTPESDGATFDAVQRTLHRFLIAGQQMIRA
jgi:hypothetical protein